MQSETNQQHKWKGPLQTRFKARSLKVFKGGHSVTSLERLVAHQSPPVDSDDLFSCTNWRRDAIHMEISLDKLSRTLGREAKEE